MHTSHQQRRLHMNTILYVVLVATSVYGVVGSSVGRGDGVYAVDCGASVFQQDNGAAAARGYVPYVVRGGAGAAASGVPVGSLNIGGSAKGGWFIRCVVCMHACMYVCMYVCVVLLCCSVSLGMCVWR
jgi:hypothetical protein